MRYRSDVLNLWNFLKTGFYEGIKIAFTRIPPGAWEEQLFPVNTDGSAPLQLTKRG